MSTLEQMHWDNWYFSLFFPQWPMKVTKQGKCGVIFHWYSLLSFTSLCCGAFPIHRSSLCHLWLGRFFFNRFFFHKCITFWNFLSFWQPQLFVASSCTANCVVHEEVLPFPPLESAPHSSFIWRVGIRGTVLGQSKAQFCPMFCFPQ